MNCLPARSKAAPGTATTLAWLKSSQRQPGGSTHSWQLKPRAPQSAATCSWSRPGARRRLQARWRPAWRPLGRTLLPPERPRRTRTQLRHAAAPCRRATV